MRSHGAHMHRPRACLLPLSGQLTGLPPLYLPSLTLAQIVEPSARTVLKTSGKFLCLSLDSRSLEHWRENH